MTGEYDDILYLPRHVSTRRKPMPAQDRAAQFSPFAALTGYDAAIAETGRSTEARIRQEAFSLDILDRTQQLLSTASVQPEITVTHFIPDTRKDGGRYACTTGRLKRLDDYARVLILEDGSKISMDDILSITCTEFPAAEGI